MILRCYLFPIHVAIPFEKEPHPDWSRSQDDSWIVSRFVISAD